MAEGWRRRGRGGRGGRGGQEGRGKLRGPAPDHRLQEQQPLRDQCLSASPCAKQRRGKSSQTRAHCHGILATVSVSQVTGTDITSRPCVKQSSVVEPVWADRPCTYSTWRARTCVCARQGEWRRRARGVWAVRACGQPGCARCQRKRSQLQPSGGTTWLVRASVVPQHIGAVKINTVTLFGKKKDSRSSPTAPVSVQVPPEELKLLGRPLPASLFDLNKTAFFFSIFIIKRNDNKS